MHGGAWNGTAQDSHTLENPEVIMAAGHATPGSLPPHTREFYQKSLDLLLQSGIPFLVGGAYGLARYAGVVRHTKDLDVFVRRTDSPRVLAAFAESGFRTELTFPHWLGKVFADADSIDVIHASGNGICPVDDDWFRFSVPEQVLGRTVRLCPVEEMIWSKAFIMERERYDGADIAHLIRARAAMMDWDRLVARFRPYPAILLNHLVLFDFIYPAEKNAIPRRVFDRLIRDFRQERTSPRPERLCRGTLISRAQYLPDIEHWGYKDARLSPHGTMSARDVEIWTAPVKHDGEDPGVSEVAPPGRR